MSSKKSKKGFTIVELSLSSAFLGILLVSIALLITHIITIYQKGMTLKAVNTVGEDLIDDLSRSVAASPAADLSYRCGGNGAKNDGVCADDNGYKYMYQQRYVSVKIASTDTKISQKVPASGAFCTGKYSYIWNTGYVLDDTNLTYTKPDGSSLASERAEVYIGDGASKEKITDFRLLRVSDVGRQACQTGIASGTYAEPGKRYEISSTVGKPIEMLEKSEDNLALYDLTIFHPTYHDNTHHAFYSGTFILATIRGGVNIMASGDYCTDTSKDNLSTDFAYCAMNKFNFATRATGEENPDE